MIYFINRHNRARHRDLLRSMFRQRKVVFIDTLGWDLKTVDGDMEVDEFDTDHTNYVISSDDGEDCLGSMRLIPSMQPHLMSEVFPHMCRNGVPRHETIWESTRSSCHHAGLDSSGVNRIMSELYYGMIESSILYGFKQITFVANMKIVAGLARIGWDMLPLGIPQYIDKEINIAMAINVSASSLDIVRGARGLDNVQSRYPETMAA